MKPTHQIRILKRLRGGFGTAVILGILIPQLAVANPLGPKVVSGQASFATQGNTLTVTNGNRAIINWQNFSIGNGEVTRFIQPTATSAVLNRVIGNNPSAIYGALQSNGRVYLVNQSGIFIGPTATIDVNGLVASTLNITDGDFKAGRINFSGGPLSGRIENQGAIRTPAGGSIYLIAPDVTNSGIINAPNGDILLAAGQQVSLVESTTPEIAVVISAPGNQALNLGRIIAEAGRIGIYGGLIRHRGIVSADSALIDKTGAIHFRATKDITFDKESITTANGPQGGSVTVRSDEGTTLMSGTVDTRGSNEKGGTIQLLGRRVGVIDAAQIDASGERGGGTVLVGGDYQGKNPAVQNADGTYFGADARIKADATTNGDGGKVILWGNEATRSYGSISARGGEQSGNGGFVETSGGYLDVQRAPDVMAPRGKGGTWLLDPYYDVTITNSVPFNSASSGTPPAEVTYYPTGSGSIINNSILSTALASSNVIVKGIGGDFISTLTVSGPITWVSPNSLTLDAEGNIYVNAAISGSNLLLYSANQPSVIAADINLSGNLAIHTMGTSQTGGKIIANKLLLWGTGTYSLPSTTNSIGTLASIVGGSFNLTNSGPLSIGAVSVGPYAANGIIATGNTTLSVTGTVTANGPVNVGGVFTLSSGTWSQVLPSLPGFTANDFRITGGTFIRALSGDGSSTTPYQLADIYGLQGVVSSGMLGKSYALANNIGAGTTSGWNSGAGFVPLGDNSFIPAQTFTGTFDGLGHTITGLYINRPSTQYVGMFGGTSGTARIRNVGLVNMNITGGFQTGGLVAHTGASVENCYTTGQVTSSSNNVGGLVGLSAGSVSNSYSTATVNGNTWVGGLVGTLYTGGSITNSYSTGTVNGTSSVGGLVGYNYGVGPIVSSYWDTQTSGRATSDGGIGKTTAQMKQRSTFVGWDFVNTWNITEGATYPLIVGLSGVTPTPPAPPTCTGGQYWDGLACVCPVGQNLTNGVCQAQTITCPTGQELVNNTCRPISCPTGQQLVVNTCQPIICPGGQQLVVNTCQPIICPGGQVYIGTGCQCPAGTLDYAGVCKTPSIVPGTDSSTVIYFPVTEELGVPLQVLVQSMINTIAPSLFTTSGSPGGGRRDDFKPQKNYCN